MKRDRWKTGIDRRAALGLTAFAFAGVPCAAGAEPETAFQTATIPLWPSGPPGGVPPNLSLRVVDTASAFRDRQLSSIAEPVLTSFRPAAPDGSALLIIPGGGYLYEAFDLEGIEPATRFVRSGITAFVLTYRLPAEGWKNAPNVPLEDAQRAMRLIRSLATRYPIAPDRVGVLGFSAGGHLAALLSARFSLAIHSPSDEIDSLDARPEFSALLYPVITMQPPFAHEASSERLLGPNAAPALRAAYSAEEFASADVPSSFLCAAGDDPDVSVENALMMYNRLRAARTASEIHLFEKGGHGFGVRNVSDSPGDVWPDLFLRWGRDRGYFHGTASVG